MEINMAFRHILLNVKLILILTIILLTAKFTKNDTDNVSNDSRLTPVHYDIEIRFDVYRNVFFGKCNITIRIFHETDNIIIKSSGNFAILEVDLINDENQIISKQHSMRVNIQKLSSSNETHIYFDFSQSSDFLSPGTYILKFIYVCSILDGDPLQSYYRYSTEVLKVDSIKVIRAVELFPSFDTPLFKSTFNISIYHHKHYRLLSNMPIRKTVKDRRNMWWTHFDKSRLMSAQHLTIVIINTVLSLTKTTSFTNNVQFWYKKKMTSQMLLAETIAEKVVHFLKKKSFQEIPKIQYIAIRGFQYINVRVPGFILLREEDITYNNKLDHITRKMKVANLIAYQTIAYCYDDVYLWFKEGFITFMAAYILNKFQLIYRMMDLYNVQTQQESLRLDTLFNKNSILLFTENVFSVYSLKSSFFVHIKSSLAWRMLYHLMPDDVFWNSLNTYCINPQYNRSNILWNIMQTNIANNSGNPHNLRIKDIINTWIVEQHYPQKLYVERSYLYNITIFSYIISHYDINPKFLTLVTYKTKSNNYGYFVFDQRVMHVNYEFDQNDWIIVNLHQTGYYRVNYNIENWENLAHHLYYTNYTDISVLNRAQIIDDAFYFYMQKELNFTTFWNITHFLFNDTDYVAWYPMIKAVEYMTCIWPVQNTAVIKNKIKKMFRTVLLNIKYQESKKENDYIKYLREEAAKWACVLGEPKCRKIATFELEQDLRSSRPNKSLEWKEWIYCKGLMKTNYSTWFGVYKKWEKTKDNTLLKYLTCSTESAFNQNYLRLIIEGDEIRFKVPDNEIYNIVLLILAKHAKRDAMFRFVLHQLEFSHSFNLFILKKKVAVLIVIITHEHSIKRFKMISEFVKKDLTDQRLLDAIEQKIKRRKNEYNKRVMNFEFYNDL